MAQVTIRPLTAADRSAAVVINDGASLRWDGSRLPAIDDPVPAIEGTVTRSMPAAPAWFRSAMAGEAPLGVVVSRDEGRLMRRDGEWLARCRRARRGDRRDAPLTPPDGGRSDGAHGLARCARRGGRR